MQNVRKEGMIEESRGSNITHPYHIFLMDIFFMVSSQSGYFNLSNNV